MRIKPILALLAVALFALLSACGSGGGASSDGRGSKASGGAAASGGVCSEGEQTGQLAAVCKKGTLTVSTDPAYPPQSSLDQKTGKYQGFDIDVATEIAKRLGVKVGWETPSWDVITAGGWNGRWDTSVGSMTPTNDRQKVLYFTQPYSYTPAVVVVAKGDDKVSDLSTDLDGAKIGVCSGCTYEQYLNKKLNIQGYQFDFVIDDAKISGYDTDTTALQDLTNGRLDAVMTSATTAQGYIDAGNPVKIVGDPVFYEPLAIAFDKSADPSAKPLSQAVDKIVAEMHADGTLTKLSQKWYKQDLTTKQ